jgi:ferredoxin
VSEHVVRVDAAACAGHGRCYALAPNVFEDDDEGRSVVVAAIVDGDAVSSARRAASNCPERAITVEPA